MLQRDVQDLDLAVVEINLPGISGFELIERIHAKYTGLPVVVLTNRIDAASAVTCLRAGAFDYITKPFGDEDLVTRMKAALHRRRLFRLASQEDAFDYLASMMGPSQEVARLSDLVNQVAPTDLTVLLEGESGTGKGLLAQRVHALSQRSDMPFIPVDCGAIPEGLIESEFFGSKKGSFTGSTTDRRGVFQAANGGTLFLDEIGNLPLVQQSRLLRVLQEKKVVPVGDTRPSTVDVRVITASNASLEAMVAAGKFRLDLFHRISEFPIEIPPLRDRSEDLLFLCRRFLREACEEFHKTIEGFSMDAIEEILTCGWPGNVRELRSTVRRAVLLSDRRIEWLSLKGKWTKPVSQVRSLISDEAMVLNVKVVVARSQGKKSPVPLKEIVGQVNSDIERALVTSVIEQVAGNKSEAARILQIDYKTIHNKLRKFGGNARTVARMGQKKSPR
jgi:two-component system nitrogen regulation response regulator GlnG